MTTTEVAPAPSTTADAGPIPEPQAGLAALLGSGDHKAIGRLWILSSFLFLIASGIAGAAIGLERADLSSPDDFLDVDVLAQTFSFHSVVGVFLFAIPLVIGIATYVVPLQVGASSVAFPRAAAAAFWTYLVSGGIIVGAFAGNGGPFGGEDDLVDLFVAAMVLLLAALVLAIVCVATTALALRTPGMTLRRTPLFTWSTVVTAGVWILTLPVLAGVLILVYVDTRYGQTYLGGADGVYTRIGWAFSQPSVYVFAIPALGIVGDIVPVAAQTRITLHRVAMGAIATFGIFSVGAWAMPNFGPDGGSPIEFETEPSFVAFSFLVVLPLLVLTGLLADTVRRGAVRLTPGLLFAAASLLLLLGAAADGALISISRLDLVGTAAQAAHSHGVLIAALLGAFAGLAHWSPKLWGATMPAGATTALAAGGLLGAAVLTIPDLVSGFLDQGPLGIGVTDDVDTIEALNIVSLGGGLLVLLVAVAFVGLVLKTAAGPDDADDDPIGGHTLEWATASPPPVGNFATIPEITSEAPLYDARHAPEGDA